MTFTEAMVELKAAGSEATRKTYANHGNTEESFGVSFEVLRKLAKKIKSDQRLANQLWQTKVLDARLLACMIADPAGMTGDELDGWARDVSFHAVADIFVAHVAANHPERRKAMERWIAADAEFVEQSGWAVLGYLASQDNELLDEYFMEYLSRIEREIGGAKNRVKHTMNAAVINIGLRNAVLMVAAKAAAKRIGVVKVDHGKTACKTPDAAAYIDKTLAYRKGKAAKSGV